MKSERKELMKATKAVNFHGKTANGYCFRINDEGEASIYCKQNECYRKSPGVRQAVREVLNYGKASNIYIWQWYVVPVFNN